MKNLLVTKDITLQELLGNGKYYVVPDFQRDYSWNEEQWEDLWYDLLALEKESDAPHYMGSIVLQTTAENKKFIIVDGQQRITTLSILALAVMNVLKNFEEEGIKTEDNTERFKKVSDSFIGEKSLSDLHYRSKLKLNENNNTFYQNRLLELKKPINFSKLRDSEKLLYRSFKYFFEKLKEKFKTDEGSIIGAFLEKVADSLVFIQIQVDDDISAYTVFETLNARGVELTTTDLLKNYLFSLVAHKGRGGSDMDILKDDWTLIVDTVNLKKFPTFLRFFLNSKRSLVRKERLFKELKKDIKSAKDVFDLMEDLKEMAFLYAAIQNPSDEFWSEFQRQKEIRQSLEEIRLFGISQPIPLLFSIFKKQKTLFSKILKIITAVSFRYNVIGKLNPNEMERVYNKIAQKISKGVIIEIKQIKQEILSIYVNDNDFGNTFRTKVLPTTGKNKKLVKYILTKIENQISDSDYDYNDANFTIEHIVPENFDESWNEYFSKEAEKYIYRLGNYTLLEAKKNRQVGNSSFEEKKKMYKKSRYHLTQKYLNYDEWNITALNNFQGKLAKYAKTVWKI